MDGRTRGRTKVALAESEAERWEPSARIIVLIKKLSLISLFPFHGVLCECAKMIGFCLNISSETLYLAYGGVL